MTVFDVETSNGGIVCTEIRDQNPPDTKVYDLVAGNWVVQ